MPDLTELNKLSWDESGEKLFETGVDHCVLYPYNTSATPNYYGPGVVWNGISSVSESPEGAEANAIYADNIKYLNLYSAEEFKATLEAYMYPDEFEECDGSAEIAPGITIGQQDRKLFGLCYRTVLGSDTEGNSHGYKIHCIYGAMASPSEKSYTTINDSPEAITFSWELNTTPVNVTDKKPTATLIIDSTKVDPDKLKALEEVLYGVDAAEYDSTKTYDTGDYCIKANKVYKANDDNVTGEWNDSKWDEISTPMPRLPLPDEIITMIA